VHFPRYDRVADELCVTELAAVVWAVQMSTVEFHQWNSRRADTERPDEWRIGIAAGSDHAPVVADLAFDVRPTAQEHGSTGTTASNGDLVRATQPLDLKNWISPT
jgi:DNA primase